MLGLGAGAERGLALRLRLGAAAVCGFQPRRVEHSLLSGLLVGCCCLQGSQKPVTKQRSGLFGRRRG